jgi:glycosyltransferase involved in cell wall biosynthesis
MPALCCMQYARRLREHVSTGPSISFVLPCFNEGFRIASSLATLESWFGATAEVLVIDDGSVDDTFEQAARYASRHDHVRVHRMPRHRGKGGAIRTAIPLVRADLVVLMDADLAFDRESVQRALDGLATAEMVVGNRRHDGSYYSVPVRLFGFLYRRHLIGLAFNTFVRSVLQESLRDTQCGLKAFRRTCLDRIAPTLSAEGFALDVEMLLVAKGLDVRLSEVPVHVRYESAKSSVKLLLSAWAMGSDIMRIAVRRARGFYAPARLRALAAASVSQSQSRTQGEPVVSPSRETSSPT